MMTNSDATLVRRIYDSKLKQDKFELVYIDKCWWSSKNKIAVTTDGAISANVFTVRVLDTSIVIKTDDYMVKGKFDKEVDTVKDLTGLEYFKVTEAKYNTFGSNQHIKVGGV